MSESASEDYQPERLEEAKNIALGWRIVGRTEPQSMEEAIKMLQDSAAYAAKVYDLLCAEASLRKKVNAGSGTDPFPVCSTGEVSRAVSGKAQ